MRAVKVRIYPNKEQLTKINQSFGCVRFVYNQALAFKIDRYQKFGETVSIFDLMKMVTFWKTTEERKWLNEANAQGLQQALRHLDHAYKGLFKEGRGYPNFKKKFEKQSYSVVGNTSIENSKIKFPKLGLLKCKGLRGFNGEIKTSTLSRNPSGEYFISWSVDDLVKVEKSKITKSPVGLDVGIKSLVTTSDGEHFQSVNYLKEIEEKLKYYQRRLAKSKKGSRNFKVWKFKIARLWNKITNIKKDFLHKFSTKIVKNHDLICVENLQIKNMLKNHKLAKSIQEMGWGEFFRQLEYKCEWYGKHFIKVNPRETSQQCSRCKYVNKELTLANRTWECPKCKTFHDRDINAAINIKEKGMDSILKSCRDIRISEIVETGILCL